MYIPHIPQMCLRLAIALFIPISQGICLGAARSDATASVPGGPTYNSVTGNVSQADALPAARVDMTFRSSLGGAPNSTAKGQPNGIFLDVGSPSQLDPSHSMVRANIDVNLSSGTQTLATYLTGSITKPSRGQYNFYGPRTWQASGTGWGTSAEYRMKIRGRNYGGILFSDTPTNSTLHLWRHETVCWPIRRYELDILWTHEFAPVRHRVVPYVTSGAGPIALNGGSTNSGWDRQAALVGGAGGDVRLSRFITLRAGFTMDWLKASTYGDPTYSSKGTIMVEPRIGLVWGFGLPHPH